MSFRAVHTVLVGSNGIFASLPQPARAEALGLVLSDMHPHTLHSSPSGP